MLAEATRISHIHGGVVLSMLFVLSLLRQVGGTRPNGARSHVFSPECTTRHEEWHLKIEFNRSHRSGRFYSSIAL